jgi:hypothetical protein
MILGNSLTELNPDKFPLLWPKWLVEGMITQIWLEINFPQIVSIASAGVLISSGSPMAAGEFFASLERGRLFFG